MPARTVTQGEFAARLVGGGGMDVRVRLRPGQISIEGPDGSVGREIHTDDIAEVRRDGSRVTIEPVVGKPLWLETERAEALDGALVDACCTLPELIRALHSLGSSRARSNATGQREFLAPLLDARRRAEESVGRAAVVAAFDADKLARALDSYVAALTQRSTDDRPAARRAFSAAAQDAVEPMHAALASIRRAAPAAAEPPGDARVGSWRRWRAALQTVFSAADRSWARLESGLAPARRPAG